MTTWIAYYIMVCLLHGGKQKRSGNQFGLKKSRGVSGRLHCAFRRPVSVVLAFRLQAQWSRYIELELEM